MGFGAGAPKGDGVFVSNGLVNVVSNGVGFLSDGDTVRVVEAPAVAGKPAVAVAGKAS